MSRLTMLPVDLKRSNADEEDEIRLEHVYLGVSLLRNQFPDVRAVSTKVLRTFHMLAPEMEVREIRQFVSSFADIQYGKVIAKNVRIGWLKERDYPEIDETSWREMDEGEMVEIIG